jgi:REP element-mobilizing transposase RayT
MELELRILAGNVGRDHAHLVLSYRPHQDISKITQWFNGTMAQILL